MLLYDEHLQSQSRSAQEANLAFSEVRHASSCWGSTRSKVSFREYLSGDGIRGRGSPVETKALMTRSVTYNVVGAAGRGLGSGQRGHEGDGEQEELHLVKFFFFKLVRV